MKKLQDYAATIVLAHILISGFDHLAHQRLEITFALTQNAIIFSFITVSPMIAASLLYTKFQRAGAILYLSTMALAFVFNLYQRYLTQHNPLYTSDFAPYWNTIFLVSSVVVLMVELLGCWLGVKLVRFIGTSSQPPASNS